MSEKLLNFRSEQVEVGIGPFDSEGKRKTIKIGDLVYSKHREFMQKIMEVWMRIQTLPLTAKLFEEVVLQKINGGKSAGDAIEEIQSQVATIVGSSSEDERIQLLKLLTDGQISDSDIETMGGGEINRLLTWLIDRNMESEKNFEASLNATLSKKSQDT